jgi:uncharacterized protein YkwD
MGCQCDKTFNPEKELLSDKLNKDVTGTNDQEPQLEFDDKPEKSKGGFYRVVEYRQGGRGGGGFSNFNGFDGFDDAFADFGNDFPTGRVVKQEIITRNNYNQPQSTSSQDITQEVLKLINEKRKLHGVQPLSFNQTINKLAIDSASSNAQNDDLDYANKNYKGEPLGECLFACSGNPTASKIVNAWYNESKNYNFNRGNEDAGNFTQMVWKNSKEFGFGMKKSSSGMNYIIGLFYPAGNYCGEHKANVFPAGTPIQNDGASKKQTNYQNDNEDDFEKQKRKIREQFENFANNAQQDYYYDNRNNKKNNNNKNNNNYYYNDYDNKKQQQNVYEEPEYNNNNASGSSGDFAQDSLQAHNKYRTKHHAPPLKLNSELNRIAQQYANYLAQNDCFEHSDNTYKGESLGENLYMCYGQKITGKAMTDAWYNEIKQYNFNAATFTSGTGHFTQVVWKDSKEVGFAYAQSRSGNYYGVANYYPAGNFMGEFRQNVLPA